MKKILMLHGINHNMFGQRDPAQYGTVTLAEIDASLRSLGSQLGCEVDSFQTNCEGAMWISTKGTVSMASASRMP